MKNNIKLFERIMKLNFQILNADNARMLYFNEIKHTMKKIITYMKTLNFKSH